MREGIIQRVSKGIYYHARQTALGPSVPNPAALRKLATVSKPVYPAGIAAANLLGFTTQSGRRNEVATSALSLPRKLIGSETIVYTRRPESWDGLSQEDTAMLDFLRRGGRTSELTSGETVRRTVALLAQQGRFDRLLSVASKEPPRVRAILGAVGEQLGRKRVELKRLRESLNPYSKFDFGVLSGLPHARKWQAKRVPSDETV